EFTSRHFIGWCEEQAGTAKGAFNSQGAFGTVNHQEIDKSFFRVQFEAQALPHGAVEKCPAPRVPKRARTRTAGQRDSDWHKHFDLQKAPRFRQITKLPRLPRNIAEWSA